MHNHMPFNVTLKSQNSARSANSSAQTTALVFEVLQLLQKLAARLSLVLRGLELLEGVLADTYIIYIYMWFMFHVPTPPMVWFPR